MKIALMRASRRRGETLDTIFAGGRVGLLRSLTGAHSASRRLSTGSAPAAAII